jgi:hypothetical protein
VEQKPMKQDSIRPTVLFLILGLLVLFIAYHFLPVDKRPEFLSAALLNAAFVIIAVAMLNFIWWLAGGEPISTTLNSFVQSIGQSSKLLEASQITQETTLRELRQSTRLLEDSRQTGIQQILAVSRDFEYKGGNWMKQLTNAQMEVDLMGFALLVWTKGHNFKSEILNLIRKGVNIRILIMDPQNDYFHSFVNKYQIASLKNDAAVIEEVRAAQYVFEEIAEEVREGEKPRGKFEFRMVRKGLIVCQICRTDDVLIAVPYLFSVVASESPLIVVQGDKSGLYQVYQKEFVQLWNLNSPSTQEGKLGSDSD